VSNEATTWVWNHSRSANAQRLVLLALADRANTEGRAWPSLSTLQRMTGIKSRTTVCRALADLQALGEVTVEDSHGPRGQNVYRISAIAPNAERSGTDTQSPSGGPESAPVQKMDRSRIRTPTGTDSGPAVVQNLDAGGTDSGPHNPQEPSSNPAAAAAGTPARGDRGGVPSAAAPLVQALTGEGLVVEWRLSTAQWDAITAAIERCGIPAMVAYAHRRHASARTPAWSAAAWIAGWSALPPVDAAARIATVTPLRRPGEPEVEPSRNAKILAASYERARAARAAREAAHGGEPA
jgi:hypothetical protein